jgi:type IV secretion system protein VirD4
MMTNQSLPYRTPVFHTVAERDVRLASTAAVVFTATFSLAIATQHVAAMLGHSAVLGAPLVSLPLVGSVYRPWSILIWAWEWQHVAAAKPMLSAGMRIFEYPTLIVSAVAMIAVHLTRRFGARANDLHGSAHWAGRKEISATGLLDADSGVYVGAWRNGRKTCYLRDSGPSHVLAFAPTRTGKGVGLVVPTLLSWPHSVVVHDIKGENWKLTAGWRKKGLGNLCLRFDPTCTDSTAARYNPLAEIRLGPEEVKDAQNIADMLIDPAGNAPRDHWDLTAHDLLTGVILHVAHAEPDKTLAGCLKFLNPPDRDQEKAVQAMIDTSHGREITHAVVAGTAQAVLSKSPNERTSVLSTATRCLTLYRDPIVAANTSASDFSIADLKHHDRPVSLYLTVPPSDLTRTRPLIRLLLAQLGARLTESTSSDDHLAPMRRLLLMLDEFPALGRLDFFQSALSYAAGYGIKAYLVAQDLSQLYAAYGHDESIVSNCAVRVAYAPNKIETARLISEMAGAATVRHEHRSYSESRTTVSEPSMQRPLITPDETMRLPEDAALIFAPGSPPIYGSKIRYYLDQEFSTRAKLAPPRYSDRIGRNPECPETPVSNANHKNASTEETDERHPATEPEREEREQALKDSSKEWLFK